MRYKWIEWPSDRLSSPTSVKSDDKALLSYNSQNGKFYVFHQGEIIIIDVQKQTYSTHAGNYFLRIANPIFVNGVYHLIWKPHWNGSMCKHFNDEATDKLRNIKEKDMQIYLLDLLYDDKISLGLYELL